MSIFLSSVYILFFFIYLFFILQTNPSSPSIYSLHHLLSTPERRYGLSWDVISVCPIIWLMQNKDPPTPCLCWAKNLSIENGLHKSLHVLGLDPGPTATYWPSPKIVNFFYSTYFGHIQVPQLSVLSELPLVWISWFCGFPQHVLHPFVPINPPPFLELYHWSLAQ